MLDTFSFAMWGSFLPSRINTGAGGGAQTPEIAGGARPVQLLMYYTWVWLFSQALFWDRGAGGDTPARGRRQLRWRPLYKEEEF